MHRTLQLGLVIILTTSMTAHAGSGLTKAAGAGDLAVMRTKLSAGEGINEVDSNGWTPLMWAVFYRQASAVDLLLEKGADPNNQSTDSKRSYGKGTTALMIAASDCQEDLARALLEKNAKKELADSFGNTAEGYAHKSECTDVLRVMGFTGATNGSLSAMMKGIDAGKDVNALDADGWTPLMWSVFCNELATTELLLQKGADPNIRASEKRKPYEKGTTALIIAGTGGLEDQVKALLNKKADPSLADSTGKTVMNYARLNGHASILGTLGVSVDEGLDWVFNQVKQGKKNVNAPCDSGLTPLMLAVFRRDAYVTKYLLSMGADPNIQLLEPSYLTLAKKPIPKGTSALMIAARVDKGELAALLLQKGANPRLTDETGITAESYALNGDAWSVQDALLNRSPLKKNYTQLAISEFTAVKKSTRALAARSQEKVVETLSELKGFEKVEAAVEGVKYDPSTLLLKVEFTKLEFPAIFGTPKAKFTVRLVDAATGSLEREQQFSLTRSEIPDDRSAQEIAFHAGVGSVIAEYALLAAGRALPSEEPSGQELSTPSSFGFGAGPVVMFENRPPTYWQWIEQLPGYPTYHEEGFKFVGLRAQRIAVWPISVAGMKGWDYAAEELGGQEKLLAIFSQRVSARLLRLAAAESLGEDAVRASLGDGEFKDWLESRRILPWANSRLLAKNQLAPDFDALARHPRLQGVRYLVIPHHLRAVRVVVSSGGGMSPGAGGMMMMNPPTSSATTKSSLNVAIVDLAQRRVVWNGAFTASASSNFMQAKALHENEDGLLEAIEQEVRSGK